MVAPPSPCMVSVLNGREDLWGVLTTVSERSSVLDLVVGGEEYRRFGGLSDVAGDDTGLAEYDT